MSDFNIAINKMKYSYLPIITLFFLMLFAPRTYSEIKGAVLLIILIISIYYFIDHFKVKKWILGWFTVFFVFYAIWIFIGIYNGAEGWLDYFRVNIIWGLIYFIFVGLIKYDHLFLMFKIILFSSLMISLYTIFVFIVALGYVDNSILEKINLGTNVGIHAGYSQITSHNIGTLFFTIPFQIIILLDVYNKGEVTKKYVYDLKGIFTNKIFLATSLLINLFAAFVSGRRALLLSIVISLLIYWIIKIYRNMNLHKINLFKIMNSFKIFAISILALYLILIIFSLFNPNWDPKLYVERMYDGISLNKSVEYERSSQVTYLLSNFKEAPLIGTGFGIGIKEVVRDIERPWSYEMTYLLMLYNCGLIGITVYILLITTIIKKLFNNWTDTQETLPFSAIAIGMISFFIGVASNPYLQSFDFLWVIFLPVALLNQKMKNGDES